MGKYVWYCTCGAKHDDRVTSKLAQFQIKGKSYCCITTFAKACRGG